MDLGSIKNDFTLYLQKLKDTSNNSKYNNVKMENTNIFQFSSEFSFDNVVFCLQRCH